MSADCPNLVDTVKENGAAWSIGLLQFGYLLIYCLASQNKTLIGATAFEVIAFLAFAGWWLYRRKNKSMQSKVLDAVTGNRQSLSKIRHQISRLYGLCMWAICLLLAVDFSCLLTGFFGCLSLAEKMYETAPISMFVGMHPAQSLEILAGAYRDNKNLKQAEPLYRSILAIRGDRLGKDHELTVGIYGDLGDIYSQQNRFAEADENYREAVQRTNAAKIPHGAGSVLDRWAKSKNQQGDLAKAEELFKESLKTRETIFGVKSQKAAETLIDYSNFLKSHGRAADAQVIDARLKAMGKSPVEPITNKTGLQEPP